MLSGKQIEKDAVDSTQAVSGRELPKVTFRISCALESLRLHETLAERAHAGASISPAVPSARPAPALRHAPWDTHKGNPDKKMPPVSASTFPTSRKNQKHSRMLCDFKTIQ